MVDNLYAIYFINGGAAITNGTHGTQFLVDSHYLDQEITCQSGGVYTWTADSQGNAHISRSIHDKKTGAGDIVLDSMISLLRSFDGKSRSEIAAILGSNNISNDTYRAYILANTFSGTWPSFPAELQGKVPNGSQLRVMPFSNSSAPDDPVIYASTNTSNNWNAELFYVPDQGWYRYKNSYGYYAGYTFSSMTGAKLAQAVADNPAQWVKVD